MSTAAAKVNEVLDLFDQMAARGQSLERKAPSAKVQGAMALADGMTVDGMTSFAVSIAEVWPTVIDKLITRLRAAIDQRGGTA